MPLMRLFCGIAQNRVAEQDCGGPKPVCSHTTMGEPKRLIDSFPSEFFI
jgi:hypothetical protein